MMIRGLLFLLFLYTLLVWIVSAYVGGELMVRRGLFWTGVGVASLLAWLLLERVVGFWRLRRARRSATTVAPPPSPARQSHPDDVAFDQIVQEANRALAESETLRAKATTIFDLPMVLVLGAEGSGKTSAVIHSGLEPILLAGQAENPGTGTTPTRSANVWYAGDLIYLDISGRIASGDAARFAQWLGILRRQQPNRSRAEKWLAGTALGRLMEAPPLPPNLKGLVLTVDLKDFVGTPEVSLLDRAARSVREKMDMIAGHFQTSCPTYVLFTRGDQIPYFREFFQRLPESEASQVFGIMTPRLAGEAAGAQVWAEAETRRLNQHFNQLFLRLSDHRLKALTTEPEKTLRPGVYEFPREFKRLRAPLVQFLVDVFRPNPLRNEVVLRGFFFSGTRMWERISGQQQRGPSPIDATKILDPSATELFGAPPPRRDGVGQRRLTWIFLPDIFNRVIPLDRPAKPTAPPVNHAMPHALALALSGVAAVIVLAGLIWSISWFGNRRQIAEIREAVERVNALPSGLTLENLRTIDTLRAGLKNVAAGNTWRLHWGLYTGTEVLKAGRTAYFRRLKSMMLDDANTALAIGMRQPERSGGVSVYDGLKSHLTIAGKECPVDETLLKTTLGRAMENRHPGLAADQLALIRLQLEYYAHVLKTEEGLPVKMALDGPAVDKARADLANSGGLEGQLNVLLAAVDEKSLERSLKVKDRSPDYAGVLNGPAEFRAVFTKNGATAVESLIDDWDSGSGGEECVTGNNVRLGAGLKQSFDTKAELRGLYYKRYADEWREFLKSFHVVRFGSVRDAADKLDVLIGPQAPLLTVVKLAAENTDFRAKPGEPSAWDAIATKILPGVMATKKKGEKVAAKAERLLDRPKSLSAGDVARLMQPVHFTTPPGLDVLVSEGNQAYVTALRALQQSLDTMSRGSQADMATLIPQAQQALAQAKGAHRSLADKFADTGNQGLKGELASFLEEPLQLADAVLPKNPVSFSAGRQNAELATMCRAIAPLMSKYPFNPRSTDETTPAEIQRLFAPTTGVVWQYHQKSLAEVVVRQGPNWVPAAPKPKVSPGLIGFLDRAQQLTDVFFTGANGMMQLRLTYSVRPVPGSNVRLRLDGKEMNSARSSLQTPFQWPAAAGTAQGAQAYLVLTDGEFPFGQYDGLWGVFRLFQNADERAYGDKRVVWSEMRGRGGATPQKLGTPARLEFVELPGGIDLFNPKFFEGLRCPTVAVLPE